MIRELNYFKEFRDTNKINKMQQLDIILVNPFKMITTILMVLWVQLKTLAKQQD